MAQAPESSGARDRRSAVAASLSLASAASPSSETTRRRAKTAIPGVGKTPSFLAPVVTVTKANMKATVLKDKYVSRADLCKGIEAACTAAGI